MPADQLPAPAVPRPVPDARKEFPVWETAPGEKQVVGSVRAPGSTHEMHTKPLRLPLLKHEILKEEPTRLVGGQLAVPWQLALVQKV